MSKVVKTRVRGAEKPRPIYGGFRGMLARAYDAVVGIVLPGTALEMRHNRIRSAALLSFEAAVVDRMMPREVTASADAEVLDNLDTMRARSRRQTRDDGHAESAAVTYEDAVVGDGVRPQCATTAKATGQSEDTVEAWREACSEYFEQWSELHADATGHGSFYELQALVSRTRKVDGECFAHTVVEDGLLTIELIDADRIGSPDGRDTDTVRGGVKVDAKGKAVGYFVAEKHPNDVVAGRPKYVFVPAAEGSLAVVMHHFRRKRVSQTRGYPDSAAGAQFLEHLHHYLRSEIIGARAAANYAMFIKKAVSAADAEIRPVLDVHDGVTETVYHERLEAGTIAYLNEGEEPVAFNPNRPGAGDDFVKRMLRAYGGAHGMSYERLARDYGGMNYTSMRGLLKEEQRGFDRNRALLCRQFCTPVWRNVIRHGIASGELAAPPGWTDNPEPWLKVHWIPPAVGWVDPTKEIQSSKEAIEANLSDPWHEAGRSGLDPIQVLERRARFLARAAGMEQQYGLAAGSLTGGSPVAASVTPAGGSQSDTGEQGSDATGEPTTTSTNVNDTAAKDTRSRMDALGLAVRSGVVTPSPEVEEAIRGELGLPSMGQGTLDAWDAEPVRRPITIAQLKESPAVQADEIDEEGNPTGDGGDTSGDAADDGQTDAGDGDGDGTASGEDPQDNTDEGAN